MIPFLAVVLVVAGADSLSTTGAQEADDAGSNVTITVGATGTTSAPPDLAVVHVAVESSVSSADAARAAVAGGATRVDGVRFTLAEETRGELRNDALENALASARTDADVIANPTDVEVRAVTPVETVDGGWTRCSTRLPAKMGRRSIPAR